MPFWDRFKSDSEFDPYDNDDFYREDFSAESQAIADGEADRLDDEDDWRHERA